MHVLCARVCYMHVLCARVCYVYVLCARVLCALRTFRVGKFNRDYWVNLPTG